MADGGIIGSGALLEAIAAGRPSQTNMDEAMLQQIARKLDKLDKLDDLIQVSATNRTAELRLDHSYDDTLNTWDRLKKRNTIRRA